MTNPLARPSTDPVPSDITDSALRSIRRVQLIFPPMVVSTFQSRQTAMFPMGLGYLAAVLEPAGYEVSLLDCPSEGYDTLLDIGKGREVYGLSMEQIRERILQYKPHAIGISCLFSSLHHRMLMIAKLAKEIDPDIVVICGGPHTSAYYRRLILDPAIDYCVLGEGDEVFLQLLDALNKGGKGLADIQALCYRRDKKIIVQPRRNMIEDLDTLPFPARHLVDMETYFRIGEPQGLRRDGERQVRVVQMTTSRGCPFRCTYCAKSVTWGHQYRTRSAENVLAEMEHLIHTYGAEHFAFQDDNLTADMDRAAAIFDGIVERKLNITWEAPNGLGINYLNADLLEKMKASGCTSFTIAVESGSAEILRRFHKPNYIKQAPVIVNKAKALGIEVRGFFMIGFPGETLEDVQKTVSYRRSLDLTISNLAIVTPLAGTPLFDECVEKGLIDLDTVDFEDFAYGSCNLQLAEVPNEQLKMIRKVEWLRTLFLDQQDRFRTNNGLKQADVLNELAKAVTLYPENNDVARIQRLATKYYEAQSA